MEAAMSDRATRQADKRKKASETGVHPIVIKIAMGAVLWFVAIAWIAFAGSGGVDLDLTVATLFFAIFFTLFLLLASHSLGDPRWPVKQTSLREFLNANVGTASGVERGRDVLIEIALVPVTVAFAATLIGLDWLIFG
jgi:hypothetical protein